jgi:hypothetical protein
MTNSVFIILSSHLRFIRRGKACSKLLLFFFSLLLCFIQSNRRKVCISILNLVTSPRQAALGGKSRFMMMINQANFNPATINAEMDNHLALNYGSYFGVTYGTASYAYTYDRHCKPFRS